MNKIEDRYRNDPVFYRLVCEFERLLNELQVTPTEIREAAMLAQIRFETFNPEATKRRWDAIVDLIRSNQ